jgi:hypothetical protein
MNRHRWLAAAAAASVTAGLMLAAGPAFASGTPQSCNGSTTDPGCNGTVAGEVIVPASLTLALQGTSFSIPINAGSTGSTPLPSSASPAVIAYVYGSGQYGYSLTEALSPAAGFATSTGPAATLSGSVIYPWSFAEGGGAYGGSGGFTTSPFGTAGTAVQVYGTSESSVALGDTSGETVPLAWQVQVPAIQAAGTYDGSIDLLALLNLS